MKVQLLSAFYTLRFFFISLVGLWLINLSANAQSNNVTVSAASFQHMVYSATLYTQLALKPELGACLQTLLEMQRRNPKADVMALTDLSRQALQFYRTNEPVYIRTNGYTDEILAAYLDALRHIPAHTNFISADLTLLNYFLLDAADYNYFTNNTVLDLINSTDQRLFSSEGQELQIQALANSCVTRAQGNAAFAAAMNGLLLPETGVSLQDTSVEIIDNTNSPLYGNGTMTTLLALSQASSDGSLTVSSNQLASLFTNEMQTVQNTISTNLTTLAEINQRQPDYLAYLTNQAAIKADVQLMTAVQQGQPARLASATAAVLVQSQLLSVGSGSDQRDQTIQDVGDIAAGVASLATRSPSGIGSVLSGGLGIFSLFGGGSSDDEEIENQIQNVQTSINDLSQNVNYRFDRVDQSLTTIFNTMNQQFSQIEITLDAQGQQIAQLNGNVDDIRNSLVTVQSSLDRIEAENFASFSAAQHDQIVGPIDNDLLYQVQYPSTRGPFPEVGFGGSGGGYEADEGLFYKYALNDASDAISAPSSSLDLSAADLKQQLMARPLDANLNYLQQFLTSTRNVNTVGTPGNPFYLANPQEWFIAADAYLQLAGENPMYFRKDASLGRVSDIISRGQNIANFCSSLTLIPGTTNINWTLWNALENDYVTDLNNFNNQVSAAETAFANANNFNLGVWRQWDLAAPRVTVAFTAVLDSTAFYSFENMGPAPASLTNAVAILGGTLSGLALKADGTVAGWGDDSSSEIDIPGGLTNAVAIAFDGNVGMAVKADGTVIGWGDHGYPIIFPPSLNNVIAIAAGEDFAVALKTNGTVVAWGDYTILEPGDGPYSGDTNVPPGLTDVVAIAAGGSALALKANGTVVAWGDNTYGETNVPAGLTNVVAIAAGDNFNLALKSNGTVVGWGDDDFGQTDIPAGLTNVVAISAEDETALALRANGTVIGWGVDFGEGVGAYGEFNFPTGLTNVIAIAAGAYQSIVLLATNTVGTGSLSLSRGQIPAQVGLLFQNDNQNIINELNLTGSSLDNAAGTLAGDKLLLTDVLELGMPYTLANDGILHGFIYGSDSLVDTGEAINFLQTQDSQLQASPETAPQPLTVEGALSYVGFQDRLGLCLTNLQATGQPEIPRLVGHTLRLLNLLSDAWTQPTNSPPPALQISSQSNAPVLLLYGEPFMNYTLQQNGSLGASGWTTTLTNLQDEQTIIPSSSGTSQNFYRLMLPTP
jgi:hypothetical protein